MTINNKVLPENENYLYFKDCFAEVALWCSYKDNKWVKRSVGGYYIPYSKRGKGILYDDKLYFQASSGDETQLLLSVYQPYADVYLKNKYRIISKSDFEKKDSCINDLQFLLAGIISVLCIFSLILFLFLRNKAFVFYSLYAIIIEIYFLTYFNIIEKYLLFNQPQINKYLFFCLTLGQPFYFLFLNELLKPIKNINNQRFIRQYAFISLGTALSIIAISLFNFKIGVNLSDIYSLINSVVGFYIIVVTFKDVPKRIRIVYIGFISIVSCGTISILLNYINSSSAYTTVFQLGFFIELTFFFIAISYTYFIEKNSRVKAMLDLSAMENQKLEKEKEALQLKNELEQKNRKLTIKAVEISEKNQAMNKIIDRLSVLKKKGAIAVSDITQLKNGFISSSKLNYWNEFEAHFTQVHPDFYKSLSDKYPGLTPTERRLCAFIKLNLTTKEIASIIKCNVESIHMTRSRLRKKMGLYKTENLESSINEIK